MTSQGMPGDSGPRWTVTGQTETTGPDASGRFGPGVRVAFRTAKGVTGSVFVPQADYSVERVRSLVAAQAAQVDAISNLSG